MSDKPDPTRQADREKFKPQNVAGESNGNPGTGGRLDRFMQQGTARGSEPPTRGSARQRG